MTDETITLELTAEELNTLFFSLTQLQGQVWKDICQAAGHAEMERRGQLPDRYVLALIDARPRGSETFLLELQALRQRLDAAYETLIPPDPPSAPRRRTKAGAA